MEIADAYGSSPVEALAYKSKAGALDLLGRTWEAADIYLEAAFIIKKYVHSSGVVRAFERARDAARESGHEDVELRALLEIGQTYVNMDMTVLAKPPLIEAKQRYIASGDIEGKIRSPIALGTRALFSKSYRDAKRFYSTALSEMPDDKAPC